MMLKINIYVSFLAASTLSVNVIAMDAHEALISEHQELVISPKHYGQVVSDPHRYFKFTRPVKADRWSVNEKITKPVLWADRSYLYDKNNIKIETVYFDFDVDKPKGYEASLELLKDYQAEDYYFLVVGHADEVGSHKYNFLLSKNRAENVKDLLVQSGFNASVITTAAKGKTMPVSFTNQAKNRRVEVVVRSQNKKAKKRKVIQEKPQPAPIQNNVDLQRQVDDGYLEKLNSVDINSTMQPVDRPTEINNTLEANTSATRKALLPAIDPDSTDSRTPLDIGK